MSDGTINFPVRSTHPDTPITNRLKLYNLNGVPYYKLDNGSENTLKGDQGDVGPTGATGPQGPQGIQGPTGPMNVEAFISETGTVTLPNSTTKSVIYTNSVTISATGDCFLDISLAVRPHANINDMEFDIEFDGNILTPEYAEEHKEVDTAQSLWRSQCFDLGNVAAGTYDLNLRFSKEAPGGTAQLKNYTAKLVRYS